jgi:hypothetical protein
MPGFSQINRPYASDAVNAAGNRDVDGYDRPMTGPRRMPPADPGTSLRARRIMEKARA